MGTSGGAPTSAEDVEAWVREDLSLEPASTVHIVEQPGSDPRCSPVVTQVTVRPPDGEPYSFHIEHALEEVDRMDVVAALAFGGGH